MPKLLTNDIDEEAIANLLAKHSLGVLACSLFWCNAGRYHPQLIFLCCFFATQRPNFDLHSLDNGGTLCRGLQEQICYKPREAGNFADLHHRTRKIRLYKHTLTASASTCYDGRVLLVHEAELAVLLHLSTGISTALDFSICRRPAPGVSPQFRNSQV